MKSSIFVFLLPLATAKTTQETHDPAQQYPYINSHPFSSGSLGPYPNRTYITAPQLISPSLNIIKSSPLCNDNLYTFISLRGDAVDIKGQSPMIFDQNEGLVWMNSSYGETFGLSVQKYRGEDFLSFWMGDDSVGGHGEGVWILLDSQYQERYRITAGNHQLSDLHEFKITSSGTALLTQYILTPHQFNGLAGNIWDSIFQELDLSTNEIKFEWRASHHFNPDESFFPSGNTGRKTGNGYDFFHLNSVDKDELGNYLISSRYFCGISYVDGRTGEVIWNLGGRRNSFRDLSGGKATGFKWQHDARWNGDHDGITLFDNGARYGLRPDRERSRGVHVELDFENMTARVTEEYFSVRGVVSASQGSLEVLESGNVLVGWGYNAAWTEFQKGGKVLCEVHVGSESEFGTGKVQSYRVGKYKWVGRPAEKPIMVWKDGIVWLSWNGATEVRGWRVEGSRMGSGGPWVRAGEVEKMGFETRMGVGCGEWNYVRGVAVDGNGVVLGATEVVEGGCEELEEQEGMELFMEQMSEIMRVRMERIWLVVKGMGVLVAGVGIWSVVKWRLSRRAFYSRIQGGVWPDDGRGDV